MSNFVSSENANALLLDIGKKKLTVTDVMPLAASAANEGIPYLYLGATTQDYKNGSIYKCKEVTPATDPKTYYFDKIYDANVDLSKYKRIWGGTVEGWEALTDEEKAQYEYTFFDNDADNYFAVADVVEDGNMHPVTSNAVAEEVDAIDAETSDIVNIYGSKNLLLFDIENIKAANPSGTWNGNSYTFLGITYTLVLNDDGTLAYVEANGTANTNAQAQFHFMRESLGKKVYMPEGHILLSGCPSGGSDPTFSQVLYYDGVWYVDTGSISGKDIAITDTTKAVDFYINIKNGTTVDHQRYYPMLRRSSIKDGSYVPYVKTNRELTENVLDSGWINLQTSYLARYRKIGKMVCIEVNTKESSIVSATNVSLGTLVEGCKPSESLFFAGSAGESQNIKALLSISGAGIVNIRQDSGTNQKYITCVATYFVD